MSDPERPASETRTRPSAPERAIVVPEPRDPRQRTWLPILGLGWVALHVAIPLRYYLGDDLYDERFAWRMFSAVRVQQCEVRVNESSASGTHPLAIMEVLPAPWAALVERNRPAVVERFLRWRCAQGGIERIEMIHACRDATGDPLPTITRRMACAQGTIEIDRERAP